LKATVCTKRRGPIAPWGAVAGFGGLSGAVVAGLSPADFPSSSPFLFGCSACFGSTPFVASLSPALSAAASTDFAAGAARNIVALFFS